MSSSLTYNDTLSGATNLLLIDSACTEAHLFFDSCNVNTFPVIYQKSATSEQLLQLLTAKFSKIDRIAFVFHDPNNSTKSFITPFNISNADFYIVKNI
jgi:hypothetical protein